MVKVYKELDNESVKAKRGMFTRDDLKAIWTDSGYQRKHSQLLALMEKFEICYRLPDTKQDTWLAPQLLSAQAPEYEWEENNNLIVRYVYDFMPKGLLSRFIVRMNRYVNDTDLVWRSGAILARQNSRAQVIETYGQREIVISSVGRFNKELMTLITEEFDRMHSTYGDSLKLDKFIPCNCEQCLGVKEPYFYKYNNLIRRIEKDKHTVECDKSYEDLNVKHLLEGVFTTVKESDILKSGNKKTRAVKVFLSYYHKDETFKDNLDIALANLKQNNQIETWNDRAIPAGEEWDDKIKKELAKADIVLLLISADFIASKYIREVEIKQAMERHERGEAKVIPIFLRSCDWQGLAFDKLQGFPKDAKPVKSFDDEDVAYTEIAKGIRGILGVD